MVSTWTVNRIHNKGTSTTKYAEVYNVHILYLLEYMYLRYLEFYPFTLRNAADMYM